MNTFPNIEYGDINNNPTIKSLYSPYELPFAETKESLYDGDDYSDFIKNAVSNFRTSKFYTSYKEMLYDLGLTRCQVHSNITVDMAPLEMHHMIFTIFEVALLIAEHILKVNGYITTFDLIYLLKQEHKLHNVPIVMLSETPHQVYHDTNDLYLHPNQVFGNWYNLLMKYNHGITLGLAFNLLKYLDNAINNGVSLDHNILELRDHIKDWSVLNGEYHV